MSVIDMQSLGANALLQRHRRFAIGARCRPRHSDDVAVLNRELDLQGFAPIVRVDAHTVADGPLRRKMEILSFRDSGCFQARFVSIR